MIALSLGIWMNSLMGCAFWGEGFQGRSGRQLGGFGVVLRLRWRVDQFQRRCTLGVSRLQRKKSWMTRVVVEMRAVVIRVVVMRDACGGDACGGDACGGDACGGDVKMRGFAPRARLWG